MCVTCDTSHWCISSVPAAPQLTFVFEQHATPVGSPFVASKQLPTAFLSALESANGAAIAPGTRNKHTTTSTLKSDRAIFPFSGTFFGCAIEFSLLELSAKLSRYSPRDARPNRSTPDLSRPCEVDAGFRVCRPRRCLLCARQFSAGSARFDTPTLLRPKQDARARL